MPVPQMVPQTEPEYHPGKDPRALQTKVTASVSEGPTLTSQFQYVNEKEALMYKQVSGPTLEAENLCTT